MSWWRTKKYSMNYQYVSIDEIYEIHQSIIIEAHTKAGVRDFGLLHSATERPKATYGGEDLYPTIFLKASALLHSLAENHPFTDGNKRTAWLSTKRFLYINRYHLKATKMEAADFMVAVDNEQLDLKTIHIWLKKHCKKI